MFANLHGYPLERTRTQIARLAEREGELDTAIAWYRLAITSPGTLPGNESQMADEVARLYRRANRPAEEEAWRVYLLDPRTTPDPTEPITVAVLGAAPQNVIAESVAGGSDRLATLGKFYMSQRRLPEAQGQFEQALQAAANEKQKAEALTGLAYCQRRLQGGEVALATAEQAVAHWLNVVETSSLDGDAHYAIEMAAATYAANAFSEKALSLLLQLKDSLSAEHSASRACFVRYRLVQEYICHGRGSDAKSLAEETLATFLDRPFRQGHSTLCGYTMVHLARLKARDGDVSGAQGLLDQLGQRWPLQFGAELAEYRESILQTAFPPAQ
jgi:tetratricopeptide (TPR) repeat protein